MKKVGKILCGTMLGVISLYGVANAYTVVSQANLHTYDSYADGSTYYYGPGYVYEDASVSSGSDTAMDAKCMKVIAYWPDSAIDTVTVRGGSSITGRKIDLPTSENSYYIELSQNPNFKPAEGTGQHYR